MKKNFIETRPENKEVSEYIVRSDKYGNSFYFSLLDECMDGRRPDGIRVITNIFDACKKRKPKERVAYIPEIPKL